MPIRFSSEQEARDYSQSVPVLPLSTMRVSISPDARKHKRLPRAKFLCFVLGWLDLSLKTRIAFILSWAAQLLDGVVCQRFKKRAQSPNRDCWFSNIHIKCDGAGVELCQDFRCTMR